MSEPLVWVVGHGGMIGSHVERELLRRRRTIWEPRHEIPWEDPERTARDLGEAAAEFGRAAGVVPWQVYWCAGAGVTTTAQHLLESETSSFRALLGALRDANAAAGSVFVASSAGGIYAGSAAPPFDEFSTPAPVAPYGRLKLASEEIADEWARITGAKVFIGRLSNVYGPGQNIDKPQGLISQMLRAHLSRVPLRVYVPLDTMRDYLYVSDAARIIVDGMERLGQPGTASWVTKVVASQQAFSLAAVVGELGRILRRRPQMIMATSPVARLQAKDLRLRSRVWPELDRSPTTPFPVGIHATVEDIEARLQEGTLTPEAH